MALVNCVDCNEQISDTAVCCPHCGYSAERVPALLQISRRKMIDLIKTETSLFSLQSPSVLTQIIPTISLLNRETFPRLLHRCSNYNTLCFSDEYPATSRRISSGILACNPTNAISPNLCDFIYISNEGDINSAAHIHFNEGQQGSFFAFDHYMRTLRSHLTRIINLYTETEVPEPYWLMISLLDIKNIKLGSSAFNFPTDGGIAIEENAILIPMQFARLDIQNDTFYLNVANAIWHVFGKENYPLQNLRRIFPNH